MNTSSRAKTCAILLAGGTGTRMGTSIPKQYLPLGSKVVARHSFDTILSCDTIDAVVVVCADEYKNFFVTTTERPLTFATPGPRRQDSVYNGLQKVPGDTEVVIIHDGARPFATEQMFSSVATAAAGIGAAAIGIPLTSTVKRVDSNSHVIETLDRSLTWEIQTPQALRADLLRLGFLRAEDTGKTVTDDVALAELLGQQVKMVQGDPSNIKVTLPTDLPLATLLTSTC